MTKLLAGVGVFGIIFVALFVFLFGALFYSIWAWSSVLMWFNVTYMVPHWPAFSGISMDAIRVAILGFGLIYTIWWGSRELTKNVGKKKTNEELGKDVFTLIAVVLLLPWWMQFCAWVTASWFNL